MSAVNDATFIDGWDRPAALHVSEEALEPGVVLAVHGELDIATAPELRERLDAAVDGGAKRVVLDLSGVTFLDSVAIATILHVRTRLGDQGRLAVVIPEGTYTRLVFEIAGLPQCLDLCETLEQAVALTLPRDR
jgi:anti-sigma B factor antagonist